MKLYLIISTIILFNTICDSNDNSNPDEQITHEIEDNEDSQENNTDNVDEIQQQRNDVEMELEPSENNNPLENLQKHFEKEVEGDKIMSTFQDPSSFQEITQFLVGAVQNDPATANSLESRNKVNFLKIASSSISFLVQKSLSNSDFSVNGSLSAKGVLDTISYRLTSNPLANLENQKNVLDIFKKITEQWIEYSKNLEKLKGVQSSHKVLVELLKIYDQYYQNGVISELKFKQLEMKVQDLTTEFYSLRKKLSVLRHTLDFDDDIDIPSIFCTSCPQLSLQDKVTKSVSSELHKRKCSVKNFDKWAQILEGLKFSRPLISEPQKTKEFSVTWGPKLSLIFDLFSLSDLNEAKYAYMSHVREMRIKLGIALTELNSLKRKLASSTELLILMEKEKQIAWQKFTAGQSDEKKIQSLIYAIEQLETQRNTCINLHAKIIENIFEIMHMTGESTTMIKTIINDLDLDDIETNNKDIEKNFVNEDDEDEDEDLILEHEEGTTDDLQND